MVLQFLKRFLLAGCLNLLLAGLALAQVSASTQLELFIDQVQAATGKFEQTIKDDPNAQVQQGEFAFQRPGKFSWHTTQPYEQLVVSDGHDVYQYDPDLDQVTQRSSGAEVANSPAALLFGSGSLADTFELTDTDKKGSVQWLRATPKQKDAGFVYVDIGFENGLPSNLNLLDSFGQTTLIKFSDLLVNPAINAKEFQFKVPDGVDLVKMN